MSFLRLKNRIKSKISEVSFRGNSGLSETLYFWMMFSACAACAMFSIYDFVTGKRLVALILVVVTLLTAFSIVVLQREIVSNKTLYQITTCTFFTFFLFLLHNSQDNTERLLWCLTYPIATTFVMGVRYGAIWSTLFLCAILIELLFILEGTYSHAFMLTFIVVYIIVMSLCSWVEFYKNKYYQQLRTQHAMLEAEIEKKEALEQKLTIMSRVDSLSKLFNQKHFWDLVKRRKQAARENQHSICMAIIDIDNFKHINDNHGHPAGDKVIRMIAQAINEHIGNEHLVGRIGGDEFGVLFIGTEHEQAYEIAEQLREKVADLCLGLSEKQKVTVSIGLARLDDHTQPAGYLYKHADLALYEAKNKGRNKVIKKTVGDSTQ